MALHLKALYAILASLSVVIGQLNPFFFPEAAPQKKLRSFHLPDQCPNSQPRADVELPSPMPAGLQDVLKGLESFLNATVDPSFPALSGKPQAAALQLDYRGEKLTAAFVGDKDPKLRSGLPDDATIFRIGSVSKIFPVLMLYQLYDQGVVSSLDDPLSKYAPDFEYRNVHSRSKRQFTLRQLASQLSGMQRDLPCNVYGRSKRSSLGVTCDLSSKEILARMKESPGAQFQEYTQPSYSNVAYSLLGNLLADYIKMPFEDYVKQHILEPLGMHNTGFVFTQAVEKQMAKPYENETFIPNIDIGYTAPAGQMYFNIKDLMTLGRYFLGISGEIFDDGLRKELLTPGFIWRDGSFLQGAPWETQLLTGNYLMFGKGGNIDGFSAVFGVIPQLNLSFAALWSGYVDEDSFIADVYERTLPEFVPALKANRPAPATPEDPSKYIGDYTTAEAPGLVISIAFAQSANGEQALALQQQGQVAGWLDFYDKGKAVLGADGADGATNCDTVMASAQLHAWMVFNLAQDGNAVSFELPGSSYGEKFVKQVEVRPRGLLV